MAGFPTTSKLIQGFITVFTPEDALNLSRLAVDILVWEYNFYLGFFGFIFILIFGFYFIKNNLKSSYSKLACVMVIFLFFSMGNFFKPI